MAIKIMTYKALIQDIQRNFKPTIANGMRIELFRGKGLLLIDSHFSNYFLLRIDRFLKEVPFEWFVCATEGDKVCICITKL